MRAHTTSGSRRTRQRPRPAGSRPVLKLTGADLAEFERLVHVEPNTGCHLWLGGVGPKGYGYHRDHSAHRLAYTAYVGPIPDGLHLDHLCRQRCCVNPDHLEPVTNAENSARSEKAQRTHCVAGHDLAGANLYVRGNGTRCCKACMRRRERERTATVAEPAPDNHAAWARLHCDRAAEHLGRAEEAHQRFEVVLDTIDRRAAVAREVAALGRIAARGRERSTHDLVLCFVWGLWKSGHRPSAEMIARLRAERGWRL